MLAGYGIESEDQPIYGLVVADTGRRATTEPYKHFHLFIYNTKRGRDREAVRYRNETTTGNVFLFERTIRQLLRGATLFIPTLKDKQRRISQEQLRDLLGGA